VKLYAWITEIIGIHALFGAFLMGVVMPEQNEFKEKLTGKLGRAAFAPLIRSS
jgi:Kef-type K+ transport system membrane component KefB